MKKRTRRTKGIFTWRQLTGALLGCGIALLGMLILSLLLFWDKAGEGAIGPVNGMLKVLCPFAAGFFALRKASERTALTGAVAGALGAGGGFDHLHRHGHGRGHGEGTAAG